MKKQMILSLILCFVTILNLRSQDNPTFENYFTNRTMRLDFIHTGDNRSEEYIFDKIIEEPYWGGSKVNLIDTYNYGNQYLKVFDVATDRLIFSRGYCTLFNEWQTIPEATTMHKAYAEGVVFPYPKSPIRIEIHARDSKGEWHKKFTHTADPASYMIRRTDNRLPVVDILHSGPTDKCVDIVLLAEGYTLDQREKFETDCHNFADALLSYEPFKSRRKQFNIRAVWLASKDEGISIPGERRWCRTPLESSFYTFDMERYLMVDNFQKVRDIAASAPYDYIYILANTPKYGGGGIYNFYGISSASHPSKAGQVYTHEFGHLFMGLGDEYQGNSAYSEMYPQGVEPWEENLTTLTRFEEKDWKKMLDPTTPIPTPDSEKKSPAIGVYEGGGYANKGVYRPAQSCMMRDLVDFCPVCQAALIKMINFHCK